MKTQRVRCLIVCVALLACSAWGQVSKVTMNIALQQPMPKSFTEWQRNDRSIVTVTIINNDQVTYRNIRLSATVRDEDHNKVVAWTKDNDPNMPRFTIPAQTPTGVPGMLILRGRECINANAIAIDPQIQTQAITTNSLPEGNFTFCAKLLNEDGSQLTTNGDDCPSFGVVIADPPQLITPEDQQGYPAATLPQFVWSQVAPVPPGTIVNYWLKVAPYYTGQTPRDAIDHNEVLFRVALPTTSYQYMPSDRPFSAFPGAIGFAWQVEADDESGKPITHNEGKSEVHTFHFDPAPALNPPPVQPKDVSGGR